MGSCDSVRGELICYWSLPLATSDTPRHSAHGSADQKKEKEKEKENGHGHGLGQNAAQPMDSASATGGHAVDQAAYLRRVQELLEHDRRYYVDNDPSITDHDYDQLRKQLERIEREHPSWVVAYSPTQRVGHVPLSAFPKVERTVPMLSLDNTYSAEDLRDFDERVRRGLRSAGDLQRHGRLPRSEETGKDEDTHARGTPVLSLPGFCRYPAPSVAGRCDPAAPAASSPRSPAAH